MSDNQQALSVEGKRLRGVGRGSRFMVLGRENFAKLITAKTTNRLNFVLTYMVLLAGTGADHRQTRWSAKACEEKLGIGRPRATAAIVELLEAGLVQIAEDATPARPRYLLAPPGQGSNEIFLPMQLVTGFNGEEPVLRRIRETGNFLLLLMLIEIYASTQLDVAFGAPLDKIHTSQKEIETASEKVFERGIYYVWHLHSTEVWRLDTSWAAECLHAAGYAKTDWNIWYEALRTLVKIGAIKVEPWVFSSVRNDAEPLFSLHQHDDVSRDLLWSISEAVDRLIGEESYLRERIFEGVLVALPAHVEAPAIKGVVKPAIEADTPGRRRSYARRQQIAMHIASEMKFVSKSFSSGNYDKAMKLFPSGAGAV